MPKKPPCVSGTPVMLTAEILGLPPTLSCPQASSTKPPVVSHRKYQKKPASRFEGMGHFAMGYHIISTTSDHSLRDGKESACNAEDLGLIPGSGRTPGEGSGN